MNFRRYCIALVAMCFVVFVAKGQEWEKVVSSGEPSYAEQICQTRDSSYWALGFNESKGNYILKLDKNANKVFERYKAIASFTFNKRISPASDNGVFVSFAFSSSLSEVYKFDKNGKELWKFSTSNELFDIKEVKNENLLMVTIDSFFLIDKQGVLIWKNIFPTLAVNNNTIQFADNNRMLISIYLNNITEYEYDFQGNLLNTKIVYNSFPLGSISNYLRDKYGSYIVLSNDGNQNKLFKVSDKKLVWEKIIPHNILKLSNTVDINKSLIIDKNNNIVLCGYKEIQSKTQGVILVLDENGNYKSIGYFGENHLLTSPIISDLAETNDGYYIICGGATNKIKLHFDTYIVKSQATSLINQIIGKIILDNDKDCIVDILENSRKNWTIEFKSNNKQNFYAYTDNYGMYQVFVDTGKYNVKLQIPSPYYYQSCDSIIDIKNVGVNQSSFDLFLQKTLDCPYLTTNIANLALRPCFDAKQVVNFCNYGTATAQNAYVEVELDPNLTYQSSSIVAINLGNGKYRFNLGDLPIDSCGQFTILTKVACDNSLLGKTLCNKVHIYPDSLCNQDLGKIKVNGTCNNTTIQFDIKNESNKAMSADKNYIIIEDVVMFKQGTFKLNANETLPILINAQPGKTYRLIAEQTNPIYGSLATTAFENCNVSASPSTGFINQFAQGDDSPFEDIDCRVVTASYDPNDKQAVPQGVQNQHYIAKNTDIEYMIRFQNKGTDTAFTVIIKDTLSQYLDPATIQPGASSHPYRFDLSDKGIAKFIFSNIQLPHQKVNDEGSNGFVKFRIKQQRDLPNGNVIKNKAAIYFDFNDPIITNETFHTIGENWLMIIPIKEINKEAIEVKIYPNPFSQSTTIELEEEYNDLTFNVFDVNGRLLRSEKFNGNRLDFERNGLDGGMYIYEILNGNQPLQKGKIVVF